MVIPPEFACSSSLIQAAQDLYRESNFFQNLYVKDTVK
jgi:hypothetical protein